MSANDPNIRAEFILLISLNDTGASISKSAVTSYTDPARETRQIAAKIAKLLSDLLAKTKS
jgi:hypothetical protein